MSTTKETRLWYVAEDPKQPGAAFAACSDDPAFIVENGKSVADWKRRGAIVQRVPVEVARAMLAKWVRPAKKSRAAT